MGKDHIPVLLEPVLSYLGTRAPYIDCTTGDGGHLTAMLNTLPVSAAVLALDRDKDILSRTRSRIEDERVTYIHGRFADIKKHSETWGHQPAAILADLGVSSMQLDEAHRGFSMQRDGPLDMRMDRTQRLTAGSLLKNISEKDLREALKTEADERRANSLARVLKREAPNISSTLQLARLIREVVGGGRSRTDPATRTFQALRRLVNDERGQLEQFLQDAPECLVAGGRLAVISFHSGEDRVVKQAFRQRAKQGGFAELTPKPVTADRQEQEANPRARSALLRVLERASA